VFSFCEGKTIKSLWIRQEIFILNSSNDPFSRLTVRGLDAVQNPEHIWSKRCGRGEWECSAKNSSLSRLTFPSEWFCDNSVLYLSLWHRAIQRLTNSGLEGWRVPEKCLPSISRLAHEMHLVVTDVGEKLDMLQVVYLWVRSGRAWFCLRPHERLRSLNILVYAMFMSLSHLGLTSKQVYSSHRKRGGFRRWKSGFSPMVKSRS